MLLEKQLILFINIFHSSMRQCLADVFLEKGYNLTPEQFLVMDTLWDEGILTQQQIADITMRDKNSIVKLIDGLEARNLVKRVNNPKDKRQNLIKVTEYSKTVKDAVTAISYEAVQKIINGIPREELESFVRTIARMQKNIDKDSDIEELGRKYPTNPGGAI